MTNEVYRKLCETLARRGGLYPGMEIPEFYALAEELFKPAVIDARQKQQPIYKIFPKSIWTGVLAAESAPWAAPPEPFR